jgi:hypothetical protein
MKPQQRLESLADALIPEAIEWVKELRAYRIYQGKDLDYFRKARIGISAISGAVRICATLENARTNDLVQARLEAGTPEGETPKALQA